MTATAAIITLPIGVLQQKAVIFKPALPSSKTRAIKKLGMGTLNKVVLAFPAATKFNPDVNWITRIPLDSDQDRWREFFSLQKITGHPVIVAFNAGDPAVYRRSLSDDELVRQALVTLQAMYGATNIPDPEKTWVTRWHEDPHSFGSYSTVRPGAKGDERSVLAQPVDGVLYWAGEAAHSKVPSTVQGAWLTGQDAAAAIAKDHPL